MSDRKYRQRGYQDEARAPHREHKPAEKKEGDKPAEEKK